MGEWFQGTEAEYPKSHLTKPGDSFPKIILPAREVGSRTGRVLYKRISDLPAHRKNPELVWHRLAI